jgi:hypothetical protein
MIKRCRSQKRTSQLSGYLVAILIVGICSCQFSATAAGRTAVSNAEASLTDPPPTVFEIAPSTGVLGREYEVSVSSSECLMDPSKTANQIKDLRLYAPAGSGMTITNLNQTGCRIAAKLVIAPDGPMGLVQLWLVKKDANPPVPQATVNFNVTSIPKGPTPTGKGAVDIDWDVLPDKIVEDNFGSKVRRQFYCVEALIGNDSGYDIQLSSVGFTLPNAQGVSRVTIPTTGYRTVRGSLEAFGAVSPRKFVISGFNILGPLLTGFVPFFHVPTHKANFSEAINIISNPLEKGIEAFWPDLLPTELDRLADQTFRDDVATKTILPNNVQTRLMTFVPKEMVFPHKKPVSRTRYQHQSTSASNQTVTGSANATNAFDPKNPQDVMEVLGDLVIVGKQIDYVNRIRVVNTPFGTSITDHTISGRVEDACRAGLENVTVTLNATDFVERAVQTDKTGAYSFPNVPDGRTYTVTAKFGDLEFIPKSAVPNTFTLNDTKAGLDFQTANYVISGTVKANGGQQLDEAPTVEVTGDDVSLGKTTVDQKTGEFQVPVVWTGASPSFKVKVTNLTKYKMDKDAFAWSCDSHDKFVITVTKNP